MIVEKGIRTLGNAGRNLAIGLGILVLTAFVSIYGMNTFLNEPLYENYCEEFSRPAADLGMDQDIKNQECLKEYDAARENYSKWIFIISIPLGLIIISLGAFAFTLNSVGIGIMLGGIYTLIYGTSRYWRYGEDWMRFLISLVGLIALVLMAYRFNKPKKKKRFF